MTIDLASLWDFSNPSLSEERFRDQLRNATGDDVLLLQTQIARSYGLRRQFAEAQRLLEQVEPHLTEAGPEVRVRYELELGRTLVSAAHPPERKIPGEIAQARSCYERAFTLARAERLDALAIDAVHMLAFVDQAPKDQIKWGKEALEIVLRSDQPAARRWEASIRNNLGCALHELGELEAALVEFQRALVLREASGDPESIRVAYWMIAWTLRTLGRSDEALAIQLRLEAERQQVGMPSKYVFKELEALFRTQGDLEMAQAYADKQRSA